MGMKRFSIVISTLAAATAVFAQGSNPTVGEVKQGYNVIKNNLTKMAEKMPEENYTFKPVPEIRAFGSLMAHIADAQTRMCSTAKGSSRPSDASVKIAKADVLAALKESFLECDAAFDMLTDANASQMVGTGTRQRSRLGLLMGIVVHGNEEYGYGAVYLRLKGIVPPSSEGR